MKDGATSKVVIYSRAEIDEVRASSKGASRSDSPWNTWYDRMALKTVIHRLEHFVPTSAEYRREQLRAAAEVSQQVNLSAPVAAGPAPVEARDVVDAEIVDEPERPAPRLEQAPPRRPRQRQQATPAPEDAPWPGDAAPVTAAQEDGDPRDDVRAWFERAGVVSHETQMNYAGALLEAAPPASLDSLARVQAVKLAARLRQCPDKDALDVLLATGEVPGGE